MKCRCSLITLPMPVLPGKIKASTMPACASGSDFDRISLLEPNRLSRCCPATDMARRQALHPQLRAAVIRRAIMLYWALVFLIIAIIAGVLGFWGVAATAAVIAKILFFLFLVVFLVTLIASLLGRRRGPPVVGRRGRPQSGGQPSGSRRPERLPRGHGGPAAVASVGGQGARQLAQCFLVALVRDLGEVAGQFEAHALARSDAASAVFGQAVKEIADRHAQYLGDLEQPAGRDAVDAALVFVRLLIGDADQIGQLLLGQTEHDPPLANAGADMPVDLLRAARGAARRGGCAARFGGAGALSGDGPSLAPPRLDDFLLLFHRAPTRSAMPEPPLGDPRLPLRWPVRKDLSTPVPPTPVPFIARERRIARSGPG